MPPVRERRRTCEPHTVRVLSLPDLDQHTWDQSDGQENWFTAAVDRRAIARVMPRLLRKPTRTIATVPPIRKRPSSRHGAVTAATV
ncbi:hypothetical protein Ssi03_41590 [Sphaerisporangium siamense]|nr:hypothetical protein Ssi03_41590 [Sphaerisporangium siamense]